MFKHRSVIEFINNWVSTHDGLIKPYDLVNAIRSEFNLSDKCLLTYIDYIDICVSSFNKFYSDHDSNFKLRDF